MTDKSLAELEIELNAARKIYETSKIAENAAATQRINALNVLNALQKQIDIKISDLKKSMPADSDWKQTMRSAL